jgi:hypothetical protein
MRRKMICSISAIALALMIAAPAAAMVEPKDQLDKELNKIEAFLHNALVKVKHKTTSMGTAPRGPVAVERDARMAPAGRCCEANIIAIADASGRLREMLLGLRYQFREKEKRAGSASVRAILFHLDDIGGRVKQFAGTGEQDFAVKFLELALAAMTNLREEKLDLDACCADLLPKLEPAAPENKG